MFYPLYVHHEPGSAWAGMFPDLPGCFTAADTLQGLQDAAQDAVQAHYGFDDAALPQASAVEQWVNHPDYQGGFWMVLPIDMSRVRQRTVRLNISLPQKLLAQIDGAARQRGQSRSAFLATAAAREIRNGAALVNAG